MRRALSSLFPSLALVVVVGLTVTVARADDAPDAVASDSAAKAATTAAATADSAAAAKPCQIAIMSLQTKGLPPEQAHVPELLSDSMATEIASATSCRVITQADIMEMLDFEAQKAACSEASESCLAEIGGALGVERVIGGSLGMLGSSFKLQIKLQNVAQGRVEKRVDRTIKGDAELLDLAARNAARELFDLPPISDGADGSAGATTTAGGEGQGQGDGAASSTAGPGAPDEGGGFGMVLLGSGIAVGALGLVAALVGAGLFGYVEASVMTTAVPRVTHDRQMLWIMDLAGVGVLGVGLAIALVGGGVAAAGAVME